MRLAASFDGWIMRIIFVVAAGLGLAGCSSMSSGDFFKSTPTVTTVQLESLPVGAEARTSNGQTCQTPCSVSVPAENFTVTFSLPKYQSETVPVQVARQQTDGVTGGAQDAVVDPNPVYAELQPAVPGKKAKSAPKAAPKAKRPKASPAAAAPAAEPQAESSPFPPPPGR